MYCKKCGAKVCCQDNYCSKCGTRTSLTLKDLRLEERRSLREVKTLPEAKQLPAGHFLAEFCWHVAKERHHPSENKYTIYTPEIPDYAFGEVNVTKDSATRLFYYLVDAVKKYCTAESVLMK